MRAALRGGAAAAAFGAGAAALGAGGAALLPTATAGAVQPDPANLLDRHRPILRYDSEERSFAVSVAALTGASEIDRERGDTRRVPAPGFLGARYADGPRAAPGDRLVPARDPRPGRPLVHGRAARDGRGRLWLQYWLFFTDNPQDRGILHTGRHSGDWELLQVRLGRDRRPVEATFAQHTWAEGCAWGEIERESGAPIVYVANGSHALHPRAGGAGPGVEGVGAVRDVDDGRGAAARDLAPVAARGPGVLRERRLHGAPGAAKAQLKELPVA